MISPTVTRPSIAWIVSPPFDLIFLSNCLWPLALLPFLADGPAAPLTFWQVYFLTTPHRWITLFLVALDPDRREGRNRLFTILAVLAVALVLGTFLGTQALLCLGLLDTIWNGWHFGSQHAGVLRIYSRKLGSPYPTLEKHLVRWFVFYTAIRAAFWLTNWIDTNSELWHILNWLDYVALLAPWIVMALQLPQSSMQNLGKWMYMLNLTAVYSGLLISVHLNAHRWAVGFALASAIFHATEYLAIVTHYAWRRREIGSAGAFRQLAVNWGFVLLAFATGLGIIGFWADSQVPLIWSSVNLAVAYLHYAYDGLIWKLRRPATASALGAGASS